MLSKQERKHIITHNIEDSGVHDSKREKARERDCHDREGGRENGREREREREREKDIVIGNRHMERWTNTGNQQQQWSSKLTKWKPTLQRRPNMQQRQQSRSPLDTNRKREKHQHCQLELGGPENQGCIRLPNSYTDGNAMEHHLLARNCSRNRQTGLWRKLYPFQRPKDAGSVACTGFCPEKERSKNNENNKWRIQMGCHRSHHQQYTKDHRISTSCTQATSTQSVNSNWKR